MWKNITTKPVYTDGALYVLIALFVAMVATFTSDEAYKYFNPYFRYYCKEFILWLLAIATALKMFRSSSFAKHQDKQEAQQALVDGNTKTQVTDIKTNEIQVQTSNTPTKSVSSPIVK